MTTTSLESLQHIIEAAIMVAGRPLTKADIQKLFDETAQPSASDIQDAIAALQEKYHNNSGIELREVASGFQFQAKTEYSPWLTRLWEERPTRYSRAFLETLVLIAYRQPITRAEIEDIRGVTVSSHIIKTLMEREWIRVIGYKDVPGKPAIYGTTKAFLNDFNLKSLDQLPTLAEIKDLESQEAKLNVQLELAEQPESASQNTDAQASVSEENSETPALEPVSHETELALTETIETNELDSEEPEQAITETDELITEESETTTIKNEEPTTA